RFNERVLQALDLLVVVFLVCVEVHLDFIEDFVNSLLDFGWAIELPARFVPLRTGAVFGFGLFLFWSRRRHEGSFCFQSENCTVTFQQEISNARATRED